MDEIGPAWLRNELPQPIANAWNLTLNAREIDGMAAAATVEVALRFVTAMQLASLLAEGGALPDRLKERFGRPTLGDWGYLTRELRDLLRAPPIPELATWPDTRAEGLLDDLRRVRNELAHSGQMVPLVRLERERNLSELTAKVLASLDWLRRVALFVVTDVRVEGEGFTGRVQTFTSSNPHPPVERAWWRGEALKPGRVYVAATDRGGAALDVDPFVRYGRLRRARSGALCLWKGRGKRGDVLLSDDLEDVTEFVPIEDVPRTFAHERLPPRRTATDATRYDVPADEARTLHGAPDGAGSKPALATAGPRRRWPLLLAALLLLGGGVAAALHFDLVPWRGDATADRTAVAAAPPAAADQPARSTAAAACALPDLRGTWRFDTSPIDGRAGRERARAVTGHYTLTVGPRQGTACALPATLVKEGYTYPDKDRGGFARNVDRLEAELLLAPSPRGRSVAVDAKLRERGGAVKAEIALRFARQGDRLVGLWRHTGGDRRAAGLYGALAGGLATHHGVSSGMACLKRCLDTCYDGRGAAGDPLAPASEPCLWRCVDTLATCADRSPAPTAPRATADPLDALVAAVAADAVDSERDSPARGAAREAASATERPALAAPCAARELAGDATFSTHIQRAHETRSIGAALGRYRLTLTPRLSDCGLTGAIRKTGYLQFGRERAEDLRSRLALDASPSGRTFAGAATLTPADGAGATLEMSFRLARRGPHVVGLWRYEGASWERRGFAGALVGAEGDAGHGAAHPATRCFTECAADCDHDAGPLGPNAERCLLACAARIDRCR